MPDALTIANAALLRIGATTIESFEDETAEAEAVRALYPTVRDALLVTHPWRFAEAEADLAQEATAASADFELSYALPSDFLAARTIDRPGRHWGFRIAGRSLCTDAEGVRLRYTRRPPEQWYPAWFEQAFIAQLASELAPSLTESDSRAQGLAQEADYRLRRAKLLDGQQDTPKSFEDFTLTAVR